MSYGNIFDTGAGAAGSAEQAARNLRENVPGAQAGREEVDPELFDELPEESRDAKIVKEVSPEALNVAGEYLAPLFHNFQTTAANQRDFSENPESVAGMASSAQGEAAKMMKAEIGDDDEPGTPEPSDPGIPPTLEKP